MLTTRQKRPDRVIDPAKIYLDLCKRCGGNHKTVNCVKIVSHIKPNIEREELKHKYLERWVRSDGCIDEDGIEVWEWFDKEIGEIEQRVYWKGIKTTLSEIPNLIKALEKIVKS